MKYFISIILLAGLLAACGNSGKAETEETFNRLPPAEPVVIAPGTAPTALPVFSMLNADNQLINLQQFAGKKVFLNLWATWCPPCKAEIPSIESLGAKTDKAKVAFVLLSLDDDFAKAVNYAKKNNMQLPVYYPASALPPLFRVDGIPVTYIFNEKGEVIYQKTGMADYNSPEFVEMLK